MPVTPTYPGVYIEEIPSGVHPITGVATSIAAFVDFFGRGPMNTAVQIFSFADFERTFGGLDVRSEASYAIQQFFLNGGTQAWVVRVASAVETTLSDAVTVSGTALKVADASGLSPAGSVLIGGEVVGYTNTTDNALGDLQRGRDGTQKAAHAKGGHTGALATQPAEYERRVVGFFERTLR